MRIHTRCAYCKNGISKFTIYDTRSEYDMRKGTKFVPIKCRKCNKTAYYHLNDLRAIRSPFFGLLFAFSIILAFFLTFFLTSYTAGHTYQWTLMGMLSGVPVVGCGIAMRNNLFKVNALNRNYVSW